MTINAMPVNEAAWDIHINNLNLPKHVWGVKVSPFEPVTVSFQNRPKKILYICQATVGDLVLEDRVAEGRSLLSLKLGDKPEILICSLGMSRIEATRLDIDIAGPSDIVLSVNGPFEIHLAGYIYDDIPPPATEVVPPQIKKSVRKKLDYHEVNEVDERLKQVSTHGTSLDIGHSEESELNENEVEKRMEQVATQGTTQVITYNEDSGVSRTEVVHVATNEATDHVIDTNDESGLNGNEVARSAVETKEARKARKKKKREAREELARSTRNVSPEYHVLKSRKSETLKIHTNHDDDQDHIRHTSYESVQNPLVDSKEAKRLKKRLKKQRQAEEYDNRASNDGLEIPESDPAKGKQTHCRRY